MSKSENLYREIWAMSFTEEWLIDPGQTEVDKSLKSNLALKNCVILCVFMISR